MSLGCVACTAEDTGEINPDAESIVQMLALLVSKPGMLDRMVGSLCERHTKRMDALAEAMRHIADEAQQEGLER